MCIKLISKFNLFNRDPTKITKMDIVCSYIFIFSFLTIIIFYTKQYYNIVHHDLELCEKKYTHSHTSCLKSEITMIIVPYIGTLYGFFQTFYKITDLTAYMVNCICCCSSIITNNNNINDITIEMNDIK